MFHDLPFACVSVRATSFTTRHNQMSSASASDVLFLFVRMFTIKKRDYSDVRVRPVIGNLAHQLSYFFSSLPSMDDMLVLAVDGDVAVLSFLHKM